MEQVTKTSDSLFKITSGNGEYFAERLILATGIQEEYPQVPEISKYYGKSLFSCPYPRIYLKRFTTCMSRIRLNKRIVNSLFLEPC